jgi:hypothetical protein
MTAVWEDRLALPAAAEVQETEKAGSRQAVVFLTLFAFTIMAFPSNAVLRAVGAEGFLAGIIGMTGFMVYLFCTLLGAHAPVDRRHPVRVGLVALWLVSLVSYALMHLKPWPSVQQLSADRWLMQLALMTGVALIAAECLRSVRDIKTVLRGLVWGGAVCGIVAGFQFWFRLDLSHYLRMLPGFTVTSATLPIDTRAAVNRVAGTSLHPIELGVTASMLLPLAIWLAMYDRGRPTWKRVLPVLCIAIAIPVSVSRSSIIGVVLSLVTFVVLLPARQRISAFSLAPIAVAGVFIGARGVIRTLLGFFEAGSADASVAHRLNAIPLVETLVRQAPWFGSGGGTFIPANTSQIVDDQYLHTAVELGLLGVVALFFYLALPFFTALRARRRTGDEELRGLCAALAGAALAAVVCSATFDSFSFPMFTGVLALVTGLAGACWLLAPRPSPHDSVEIRRPLTAAPPQTPFERNLSVWTS